MSCGDGLGKGWGGVNVKKITLNLRHNKIKALKKIDKNKNACVFGKSVKKFSLKVRFSTKRHEKVLKR